MPKITISLDDLSPQLLTQSEAMLSGLTRLGVDLQNFESLNNAAILHLDQLEMTVDESGIYSSFAQIVEATLLESKTALYQYLDTNTSLHGFENFIALNDLYDLYDSIKFHNNGGELYFDNEVAEIIKLSPSTFPDQFDALVAELRADLFTPDASLA